MNKYLKARQVKPAATTRSAAGSAAIAAGLIAALAIVYATVASLDQWRSGFYSTGTGLILYNFARLALLLLLIVCCRGAGTIFRLDALAPFDRFIVGSFGGFAILTFVGVALGTAGLLRAEIAFVVLAASLAAAAFRQPFLDGISRHVADADWISRAAWTAAIVVALAYVVLVVLPPGISDNDYTHYYPWFEQLRRRGDLSPSTFFITHFYLKGSGLAHLVAALADTLSIQNLGGLLVLLMALPVYRICERLSGGNRVIAALAAIALLAAPRVVFAGIFKLQHLGSSAVVAFIVYWTFARRESAAAADAIRLPILFLVGAGALITPVSAPFAMAALAGAALIAFAERDGPGLRDALTIAAVAFGAAILVLAWTHLSTGIFDYTPIRLQLAWRDDGRLNDWTSTLAIASHMEALAAWTIAHGGGENFGGFSLSRIFAPLGIGSVAVSALALCAAILLRQSARPLPGGDATAVLTPYVAVMAFAFVAESLIPAQASDIGRFTLFRWILLPACGVALLTAVVRFASRSDTSGDKPGLGTVGTAIVLVPLVVAGFAALNELRGLWPRAAMFAGNRSIADEFHVFKDPSCTHLSTTLPAGTRVLPVFFEPGCYALPQVEFLRGDMNDMNRDLAVLLYGGADEQAAAYRTHRLRQFVIHVSRRYNNFLYPHLHGALFAEEGLKRYFRARVIPGGAILLTLDGSDADGVVADDRDLLSVIRTIREEQKTQSYGVARELLAPLVERMRQDPAAVDRAYR